MRPQCHTHAAQCEGNDCLAKTTLVLQDDLSEIAQVSVCLEYLAPEGMENGYVDLMLDENGQLDDCDMVA